MEPFRSRSRRLHHSRTGPRVVRWHAVSRLGGGRDDAIRLRDDVSLERFMDNSGSGSGSGWSAQTEVSPALAAFSPPPLKGISQTALYMAWTTVPVNGANTIDFASWNGSAWVEWNPPIPIPPGPLTILSPALMSQVIPPPVACDPTDSFLYVGYTAPSSLVYWFELESVVTPPPPGALKGCVPE
jgi:hypothetical protein